MFSRRLDDDTLIRSYNIDDAPALHEVLKREHEHLLVWMPWPDTDKTLGDRREFIRSCIQQEADGDGFQTAIFHRGDLAGSVGFHGIDHANLSTSIGYWLAAKHQGKGIMTRASKALVEHALLELKLNRVEIRCATGNARSRAIPERLGFTQEGVLRQVQRLHERYVDHVVYASWPTTGEVLRTLRGHGWSRPCPCRLRYCVLLSGPPQRCYAWTSYQARPDSEAHLCTWLLMDTARTRQNCRTRSWCVPSSTSTRTPSA